ncbi:hypothetical protein PHJA_002006400 [Phtheirospermum japonicum]|uniref:Uncharacterized protein n=1 Tax=Phtheirospermum japonicum TaxID=374723 RepID=A0A830CUC5_9LAMI|nr:hypothetical protein PHJA_002006400 [Phtheirospermum japonicum]
MDDVFGLLYLLKLDRSIFHLEAVTINPNSWTDIGHTINEIYDLLHMMGRDDVAVGGGGEGGILEDGTILPNVGGYLPIIEQVSKSRYPLYISLRIMPRIQKITSSLFVYLIRALPQQDAADITKLFL